MVESIHVFNTISGAFKFVGNLYNANDVSMRYYKGAYIVKVYNH